MRTVVTWISPQFKDNSNSPLDIICSHQSGAHFYWGTWNVHCTAFDNNPNNNPAVCQFTIRLKRKSVVSDIITRSHRIPSENSGWRCRVCLLTTSYNLHDFSYPISYLNSCSQETNDKENTQQILDTVTT